MPNLPAIPLSLKPFMENILFEYEYKQKNT